jgi:lysophospholipase L1-like esterase
MFVPTFRTMGLETLIRQEVRRLNQAVEQACAARGVTVVDAYTAFMGRDGRTDPVAAGTILPDQRHLSDKGITKLAVLLHKKGYAEIDQTR